jgi:hypothetical protein
VRYRDVFLSGEAPDLITTRLEDPAAAASPESGISGGRSPKKRKADDASAAAPATTTNSEVSWTVCCLDGTTFSVALPKHTYVAEAKRAIGRLREVLHFAMELFVEGKEEPLDDEKRLISAEKVPLFMLPKEASDRAGAGGAFQEHAAERTRRIRTAR